MRVRLERVGLVAAMALVSLNLWTGAPLLGLWVGSRVAGPHGISMLAVAVVVLTIGAACWALARALAWLGQRYDRVVSRTPTIRRYTPWLRAMSGDRPHETGGRGAPLTALEAVLVGMVLLCALSFEVWFFFLSGSPLDGRSGR
jgi:hypothetical protein